MDFLLRKDYSVAQFRTDMPLERAVLTHFAIGLRGMGDDTPQEAIRAFEACLAAPGEEWFKAEARARLDLLHAQLLPPHTSPRPEQAGE